MRDGDTPADAGGPQFLPATQDLEYTLALPLIQPRRPPARQHILGESGTKRQRETGRFEVVAEAHGGEEGRGAFRSAKSARVPECQSAEAECQEYRGVPEADGRTATVRRSGGRHPGPVPAPGTRHLATLGTLDSALWHSCIRRLPSDRPPPVRLSPPSARICSSHAVTVLLRSPHSAAPGPDGRGVGGALPADLPADGGRRRAVRVPELGGDSAPDPAAPWRARSSRSASGRSASRSTAPIPQAMAEATALITEHYKPEFIDINFGCPVKKVVQRNGGSGCLRDLDLVERIIRACVGGHPPAGHGEDPERLERRDRAIRSASRSGCRTPAPGRSPCTPAPGPRCSAARPTGTRSPGWWRRWTSR